MKPTTASATLRLATDYRTPEPEAFAALRALRRAEMPWEDLLCVLTSTLPAPPRPTFRPPSPTMPFGKYRGHTLEGLAEDDPGYLYWLLDLEDLKPWLRKAVETALGI